MMTNDLITADNMSIEFLRSVLDAAMMETSIDEDGDIVVREGIRCFVIPNKEKDRISFVVNFGFKKSASRANRLECVNRINREYILVRASVGERDVLTFTYQLLLAGGITKKHFVMVLKRFCSICPSAIQEYGGNLIE